MEEIAKAGILTGISMMPMYERMYPHPTAGHGGVRTGDPHAVGRRICDLCRQYGMPDRVPRSIIAGDKRMLNNQIVEALANQCCSPSRGAGECAGAEGVGVSQGGVGDRGHGAGDRVPLPADEAASRGTGEDRECWAEAGGGG